MAAINGCSGHFKGVSIAVPPSGLTLGRDRAGKGRLSLDEDTDVSREHCRVQYDEHILRFRVTDLGSSNGTFLMPGDRRLVAHEEVQCEAGQVIRVGPHSLFELTSDPSVPSPTAPGAAVAAQSAPFDLLTASRVGNPRSKSETTRLLCASALLRRVKFADEVLNYLESRSRAVLPELGLDMQLLAHVCTYASDRAKRFDVYMLLCVLAALGVAIIDPAIAIGIFAVSSACVSFLDGSGRSTLVARFRRENFSGFDPKKEFSATLPAEVTSSLPSDQQNLIVYTGFVPFMGAGVSLGGWSFVVDIDKPTEKPGSAGDSIPFRVEELYQAVGENLIDLNLRGLEVEDFFFVNGCEIRDDKEILPDIYGRPSQQLNSDRAKRYIGDSDARIRHYRWIRVHDWDEELVMSYLLRCTIRGRNMFVEINRCLLTPIRDEFRKIDKLPPLNAWRTIGQALASLVIGPIHASLSPLILFGRFSEALGDLFGTKERRRRREITENRRFDYGAGQGYRQSCSSGNFGHFFQKADGDFYTKVLEKAVLDSIITFLDDHHVDTSDLRERQTLIMNSGIIVHGGDVKAESLAVGAGAQAVKTQSSPRRWKEKRGAA